MDIDDELANRCRKVIDRQFAQYDWCLLEREELLRRTIAAAREHPAAEPAYLAFGIYNKVLYEACSGAEGPLRWEQGYQEIFKMLCERARRNYPDVWEDAVQSALEVTCRRIKQCIVPQAFFQFACGHLQNAARSLRPHLRRKNQRSDISLEGATDPSNLPLADSLSDPRAQIAEQFLVEEQQTILRATLQAFVQEHPRARNQLAAVSLKFIEGKDDETISQILGVSVKRVHELRSLGLKKLRADPRIRDFLGEEDL